jgi:putative ATPase
LGGAIDRTIVPPSGGRFVFKRFRLVGTAFPNGKVYPDKTNVQANQPTEDEPAHPAATTLTSLSTQESDRFIDFAMRPASAIIVRAMGWLVCKESCRSYAYLWADNGPTRMDLFSESRQKNLNRAASLAVRMRPRTLEEFVGQQHFLGPGKLLRRMLEADRLTSVIFYGPPGTGKTTLAQLIAQYTKSHFEQVNAAAVGVKEVRGLLEAARERLGNTAERTVLFLDEIHRFNRAQQDILLPDVEAGYVLLVGATTENPFFAINSPLVSRSQIFQFAPISEDDIRALIRRAVTDHERGFGNLKIEIDPEAIDLWATMSDGDARRALMALEVAVLSSLTPDPSPLTPSLTPLHITLDIAEQSMQRKAIVYDGTGDEHYDAASALIKSMRGSDPDAAVYWVARMLEAGEDPRFIARRIAILASEDIGNADPRALSVAAAAYDIVEKIGMPEAQLPYPKPRFTWQPLPSRTPRRRPSGRPCPMYAKAAPSPFPSIYETATTRARHVSAMGRGINMRTILPKVMFDKTTSELIKSIMNQPTAGTKKRLQTD